MTNHTLSLFRRGSDLVEDTTSLVVFAMFIACSALLLYITYEPIKRWAWSDVEQKEKTQGNGSL
ncbi:hypothetical protein P4V72_21790 [Bacillus thuringiensis]|nr:hypothetical protein [Bacillus cereus]MDQ7264272.1 hypothetical protein [Bacillus thuringiensis]MDR4246793.1 hypothetical protein [Bacillus thuringiensis]MDR5044258.1 hypothetical protein [Bacillus thuringiensis]MEB8956266.1 hypothetical protein [Bacillus cereus]MEB9267358.1 hypothetical protein [Bacillus cereus]